jgi:hypothetical protein
MKEVFYNNNNCSENNSSKNLSSELVNFLDDLKVQAQSFPSRICWPKDKRRPPDAGNVQEKIFLRLRATGEMNKNKEPILRLWN